MYFTISNRDNRIVGTSEVNDLSLEDSYIMNEYHFEEVNEYLKKLNYTDEIDKILKIMQLAKLYSEIWEENDKVFAEIPWGDWKHEHLFCDCLMEALGYKKKYVNVTEEDGSDCYSAIHCYVKESKDD